MARQYFVEIGEPQRRAHHREAPELSRQHARRARGRRQRMAPRAVRAPPDRDPSHRSLLRLSAATGRTRATRTMRQRAAQALEDKLLEIGAGPRHRFRRRDRGRRHRRRRAAGRRLFQAHPRDLRPPRRAAHSRRGHVRHGANRNAARLRAGGRRARPDDHRQGLGRRLPADRRGACWRGGSSRRSPTARARSSTATPIWAIRWPRRRRSRCRTSSGATTSSPTSSRWAASFERRLGRALRPTSVRRRHSRSRALLGRSSSSSDRASKRPFDPALKVARARQARGDGARPHGLSDGRDDRRREGDHVLLAPPFIVERRRKSTRSSSASATRSTRRSPASDSRATAVNPPQKERSARPRPRFRRDGIFPIIPSGADSAPSATSRKD